MIEIDGRQIPTTLEEKVAPAHTAVVVIDCQDEFIAEDGFWAELGQDVSQTRVVAARIADFLQEARRHGVRVVHVRAIYDRHHMNDPMVERLYRHGSRLYCQSDDPASGFSPGLEPRPGEPEVIKHRFDAFYDTELDLILRAWGVKTVILSGLVTHGCVDSTARHAYFNGFYVVFPPELTGGASAEVTRATMETIDVMFGVTPSVAEIIAAWQTADVPSATAVAR